MRFGTETGPTFTEGDFDDKTKHLSRFQLDNLRGKKSKSGNVGSWTPLQIGKFTYYHPTHENPLSPDEQKERKNKKYQIKQNRIAHQRKIEEQKKSLKNPNLPSLKRLPNISRGVDLPPVDHSNAHKAAQNIATGNYYAGHGEKWPMHAFGKR